MNTIDTNDDNTPMTDAEFGSLRDNFAQVVEIARRSGASAEEVAAQHRISVDIVTAYFGASDNLCSAILATDDERFDV